MKKQKGFTLINFLRKTIKGNHSGFTLVELLVVIIIIAILATVGLVTYGSVQKEARKVKRMGDLAAIETNLQLYYQAKGKYPNTSISSRSECALWGSLSPNDVIKDTTTGDTLVPIFMKSFPSDPSMDKANNTSCYVYASDGTNYKLIDININEFSQSDYSSNRNLIDPSRDGGPTTATSPTSCDGAGDGSAISAWAVYSSPNSRCW